MKLLPSPTMPKGGGALRGMGEKFSANPATGTASLSIPIAAPPGRGGFELGLQISYDSGGGNGPFGLGFRLSVPAIARKTDRGVPRYIDDGDDADVFVLSGAEDLVPVVDARGEVVRDDRGAHVATTYRPRVEAEFARIERWVDKATKQTHWRATTRDNVTSIYGPTDASRIRHPEHPSRVFTWLLARTEDDRGNAIEYEYKLEDESGIDPSRAPEASRFRVDRDASGRRTGTTFLGGAQRYLKRIRYGNSPHAPTGFLFEIVFDYGEHDGNAPTPDPTGAPWNLRRDPFSSYRSGFEIRTYRRCRRVLVYHRFPELGQDAYLVHSTNLFYSETAFLSLLTKIVQRAHVREAGGAITSSALPALDLEYTSAPIRDEIQWLDDASLAGLDTGLDPRADTWVDLDGEGLPGLLQAGGGIWHYKRNLGQGRFAAPERAASLPASHDITARGVQLQDLGGDGALDLVTLERGHEGYYARREDRTFAPHRPFRALPNIDWQDPNLRLVDLDGDGHPDVLLTEHDVFTWYPSLGKDGYAPPRKVAKARDEERGAAVVFADGTESIHLADLSGDGLTDIVRVKHGQICYWPNLGHGRFGAKVVMTNAPAPDTAATFDPRRVRFADLDGSGPADYFYVVADGSVVLAHNEAGNGWSEPIRITKLPRANALGSIDAVDLLGNGTTCLVWTDRGAGARRAVGLIDLLGGVKPHVLAHIRNNMGAWTEITYEPSTAAYRRDRAAGRRWFTRLPFPVQCVKKITYHDLVGHHRLVTEYRYHHGHFDGREREFAGFACVEQFDTEIFDGPNDAAAPRASVYAESKVIHDGELDLPTARTVTWFHTGAYLGGSTLEAALRVEYFQGDMEAGRRWLLPDTVLPEGLSGREMREAARALRGRVLRQEVYADDGGPLAKTPYLVTEHAYTVRPPEQHGTARRPAVFFVHEAEAIRHHYERCEDDARVEHDFVLQVDPYGNVQRSAHVAYPRAEGALRAQKRGFCSVTESAFSNASEPGAHRLGVPLSTRIHELTGLAFPDGRPLRAGEIADALAHAAPIPYEQPSEIDVRFLADRDAFDPKGAARQLRVVQAERHGYWSDDLATISWDSAGTRALRAETQQLALTTGLVTAVYGTAAGDPELGDAGYVKDAEGWWAPSGRVHYNAFLHYLPHRAEDPFENPYEITYDRYGILVAASIDPYRNTTRVLLDPATAPVSLAGAESPYRSLQPTAMLDPNDNGVAVAYDAFGRVVAIAHAGKGEGDTLADPTATFAYHLEAWPPYVHARARETHRSPQARWQESYVYSDGFGREIMTKVRAEPGLAPARKAGALVRDAANNLVHEWTEPRWVGSGRTVFDNKGNPIKKYEPYFSSTPSFEDEPELVEMGVTPILRYDPLSRLVETLRPDGAISRVFFDAWTQVTWDENDTVLDSRWLKDNEGPAASTDQRRAATLARAHAGTPTVVHLDALGRPTVEIADNGTEGTYTTRTELDIEGQPRRIIDPRKIAVLDQILDLAGRTLRSISPDAGTRTSLWDVTGQIVLHWDARGIRTSTTFDELRRPTHVRVRVPGEEEEEKDNPPVRLWTVYGEELDPVAARAANLRARVYRVYDGAGTLTTPRYTFKGQVESSERRLPIEKKGAPDWRPLLKSTADAELLLEGERWVTLFEYDALDRVVRERAADGSETEIVYNKAGFLETVRTTPRKGAMFEVIAGVEYNARGQRRAVDFGDPAKTGRFMRTEYDYDPRTFRLTRIVTWRPTAGERAGLQQGKALARPVSPERYYQHSTYAFDPVGNIVALRDGARLAIIRGRNVISGDAEYAYDAIYRLVEATGREHPGQVPSHLERAPGPIPHENDVQALRPYVETYTYDAGGNIKSMRHAGAIAWTVAYLYEGYDGPRPLSNRLVSHDLPGAPPSVGYRHDPNGNMTRMPGLDDLAWSWDDRLWKAVSAEGTVAHYQYGADGQRVRKLVEYADPSPGVRGPIVEQVYVGSTERRRRTVNGLTETLERLHVNDEKATLALIERRNGGAAKVTFQLTNHLGSGTVEMEPAGEVVSYEAYTPWGRAAFHLTRGRERRLRFNGKERDDETGLHYFGARYYAAWLGRWTAVDPMLLADGPNPFVYGGNSPVMNIDVGGTSIALALALFDSARQVRKAVNDIDPTKIVGDFLFGKTDPISRAERAINESALGQAVRDNAVTSTIAGAYVGAMQGVVGVSASPDPTNRHFETARKAAFVVSNAYFQARNLVTPGGGPLKPSRGMVTSNGQVIGGVGQLSEHRSITLAGSWTKATQGAATLAMTGDTKSTSKLDPKVAKSTKPAPKADDPVSAPEPKRVFSDTFKHPKKKPGESVAPMPRDPRARKAHIASGPVNGQDALNNSALVSATENKQRRVGIDYKERNFVVFDGSATLDNSGAAKEWAFHGHLRQWSDLERSWQTALQEAGLVDKRGRILQPQ